MCATDRANTTILASWAPCGYGGFARVLTPPRTPGFAPKCGLDDKSIGNDGVPVGPNNVVPVPCPSKAGLGSNRRLRGACSECELPLRAVSMLHPSFGTAVVHGAAMGITFNKHGPARV